MKPLSANAAAKMAGKAKSTILEAIEKGDLSASKNKRGHWEIDPSELARAFEFRPPEPTSDRSEKPQPTTQKTIETSALEVEVKMLREQMEMKDDIITELRKDVDDWKGQAKQLLIANQNAPQASEKPKGFFARVFG